MAAMYSSYYQDASDEIMRRCRDREATMLRSATHTATLKTASPTYDLERLNALKELLGARGLEGGLHRGASGDPHGVSPLAWR